MDQESAQRANIYRIRFYALIVGVAAAIFAVAFLTIVCRMLQIAVLGANALSAEPISMAPAEIRLGAIARNKVQSVSVTCLNRTGDPIAIIGGKYTCGEDGCFSPRSKLPMAIEGNASGQYKFDYKSGKVGDFDVIHLIYTDVGPPLSVRLVGTIENK
ncbi:MAG TPA: hypothetical protein VHY91_15875 [Pirellulales bacterium]|jgi:hypothetical protein|nr:hypothetical protein [Pirellulales bacterium]